MNKRLTIPLGPMPAILSSNKHISIIFCNLPCNYWTIMEYRQRIESNPCIMLGKPVIKGTKITVELILKKLAEGLQR